MNAAMLRAQAEAVFELAEKLQPMVSDAYQPSGENTRHFALKDAQKLAQKFKDNLCAEATRLEAAAPVGETPRTDAATGDPTCALSMEQAFERLYAESQKLEREFNAALAAKPAAVPEGWRLVLDPFDYDRTFNAIAEAVHIEGGGIGISVRKFKDAFGPISHPTSAPSLDAASGVPVDFSVESMTPIDGMDYIYQHYSTTFNRTPDAFMRKVVAETKELLFIWWGTHRDALRDAFSHPIPGSGVASEDWQPIETAPKDRCVDLWCGDRRYTQCYHDEICDHWRTSRPSGHLFIITGKATHWREIPTPPKE